VNWIGACIVTWVLWPLSVFYVVTRKSDFWFWTGYDLGRHDQQRGFPRRQVIPHPSRRGPDEGES
jgi:hypothetical protein